jgi:hypothetical protein
LSWKKTDLERLKAASLTDRLRQARTPERYGKASAVVSRKEQRRLDQAAGLVPFAVKLKAELVERLQERAQKEGRPLNEVVGELLARSLSP